MYLLTLGGHLHSVDARQLLSSNSEEFHNLLSARGHKHADHGTVVGLGLGLKLGVDVLKLVALLIGKQQDLLGHGRPKDLARGVGGELVYVLRDSGFGV